MTDIAIEAVSYRYRRNAEALHDVSFGAPSGAILGLLGSNGAGKTTLLQCCGTPRTRQRTRMHGWRR